MIHQQHPNQNQPNQEEAQHQFLSYGWQNLCEFSALSTENIRIGPTIKTNNLEFELKPSLINMVQANVTPSMLHYKSFTKTCHEHYAYVLMHVLKSVDQFP